MLRGLMLKKQNLTQRALRRTALVVLGCVLVVVGLVGLVLPVMPTAPFMILALACFARASDRFHHWLKQQSQLNEFGDLLRASQNPFIKLASKLLDWGLDLNRP